MLAAMTDLRPNRSMGRPHEPENPTTQRGDPKEAAHPFGDERIVDRDTEQFRDSGGAASGVINNS